MNGRWATITPVAGLGLVILVAVFVVHRPTGSAGPVPTHGGSRDSGSGPSSTAEFPTEVLSPAFNKAAAEASQERWAEARTILQGELGAAVPGRATLHLLAVVNAALEHDIETALAYRALGRLYPDSGADPLVQVELGAALTRIAARGRSFFDAAVTTAEGQRNSRNLLQHVAARMAAAGQIDWVREMSRDPRLDLPEALIVGASEARDSVGRSMAWQLLTLAAEEIPGISEDQVAQQRFHFRLVSPLQPGQTSSWQFPFLGSQYFQDNLARYRLQSMGVHWLWYAAAIETVHPQDAHDAYWRGQDLIRRSGLMMAFDAGKLLPGNPSIHYLNDGGITPSQESVQVWYSSSGLWRPRDVAFAFLAPETQKTNFIEQLRKQEINAPVEEGTQVRAFYLASLDGAAVLDPTENMTNDDLVKWLANMAYWHMMALKTLSLT